MDLASIVGTGRRLLASTMLDTALISDRSEAADGAGGVVTSWTPRASAVPCRYVQRNDGPPEPAGGVMIGKALCKVLLGLDVLVDEGDRITGQDGSVWVVVGDLTPDSTTATVRRLLLREV
jgi:hypothetical protein